jgi:hypothetical protein
LITPTEKSSFKTTPNYEETVNWFKTDSSLTLLTMVAIGTSIEGRTIYMIRNNCLKFRSSNIKIGKPTLLVQAVFTLAKLMARMQV